ncbi:hypothetical protein LTR56_000739 [Elasticomyces elasticus]|nr:hypothetical protein LTR22_009105 [Elasticomyces elasticus]KAK3660363.1 hypothetical protein LTR56_000739 [Elasticomyces elasticus]KAK4929246.1 hypothetical protein LTR49_004143 [Elasticomyces elasticus]KAK5765802.1 hypothetical protein LTS12_004062 [Elasticomyces elasticus]
MDDIVRKFNNLPRPQIRTGDGFPNHWIIGVRRITVEPPLDFLLVLHPESKDVFQGPPGHPSVIQTLTPTEKAEAIVPLLIKGFTVKDPSICRTPIGAGGIAPWSWAIEDLDVIPAIEAKLRALGVRKELCKVNPASSEHIKTLCEVRSRMEQVQKTAIAKLPGAATQDRSLDPAEIGDTACHGCGVSQNWAGLRRCTGCGSACVPMRRLIVTGKDVPNNFRLFFGPVSSRLSVPHFEYRMQVLLDPPPGSFIHTQMKPLDKGSPYWSPRSASSAEQSDLDEIKLIQAMMRETGDRTYGVLANATNRNYMLAFNTTPAL